MVLFFTRSKNRTIRFYRIEWPEFRPLKRRETVLAGRLAGQPLTEGSPCRCMDELLSNDRTSPGKPKLENAPWHSPLQNRTKRTSHHGKGLPCGKIINQFCILQTAPTGVDQTVSGAAGRNPLSKGFRSESDLVVSVLPSVLAGAEKHLTQGKVYFLVGLVVIAVI